MMCSAKIFDTKLQTWRHCKRSVNGKAKYCVVHLQMMKKKKHRKGGVETDTQTTAGITNKTVNEPSQLVPISNKAPTPVPEPAPAPAPAPVPAPAAIKVATVDKSEKPAAQTTDDEKKCPARDFPVIAKAKSGKVFTNLGLPGRELFTLLEFYADEALSVMKAVKASPQTNGATTVPPLEISAKSKSLLENHVNNLHAKLLILAREPKAKGGEIKSGKTDRSEFLAKIKPELLKYFTAILHLLYTPAQSLGDRDLDRHLRDLQSGKPGTDALMARLAQLRDENPWIIDTTSDHFRNKLAPSLKLICEKSSSSVIGFFATRQNPNCASNGYHLACYMVAHLLLWAYENTNDKCPRQNIQNQQLPYLMSCWLADVIFWDTSDGCKTIEKKFSDLVYKFK